MNISTVVCADGLPTVDESTRRFHLCVLNKEYQVSVQPGDIIGLEIPPSNDDDFDIWFTKGGPTNYVFGSQLNSTVDLSEGNATAVKQLPQISFGFTSGKDNNNAPLIIVIIIIIIMLSRPVHKWISNHSILQ